MTLIAARRRAAPPSEAEIKGVLAGDQESVEKFVRWMWPRAKQIAFLLIQDQDLAEDVAQVAVLKALRALPSFDQARPIKPWMERIAVNASLDRKRKRHLRAEVSFGDPGLDEDQLEAEATALSGQAVSGEVIEALRTLSDYQRSAVVLRYLLDYSNKEIAAIARLPESTVRSHLRRGLLGLRAALENPGGKQ